MAEHYFTGKPCKRGHIAPRFTSNRRCMECHKEDSRVRQGYKGVQACAEPKLPGESSAQRWWRLNQDKARIYEQNRRARKNGRGQLSLDIVQRLMVNQGGLCVYCKADLTKVTPQIDHIMPLLLGGMNIDSNVQLLCRPCNSAKWAKHPDVFNKEKGLCAQSLAPWCGA